MERVPRGQDRLAAGLVVVLALAALRFGYRDGPPPGHTGGFGEPTCQTCHNFNPLNDPSGSLALTGLPDVVSSDSSYELTVTLHRPGLAVGGFQLAARFADGSQAGSMRSLSDRTSIVSGARQLQYGQHSKSGTNAIDQNSLKWSIAWHAPDLLPRAPNATSPMFVYFNLVGNASNDDNSEFGDFIYLAADSVLIDL